MRTSHLDRIQSLDPERDHLEIHRLTALHEFPWDTLRALELALYRTYCVPSVSALLDRTGEFRERAQKRYDDTGLLLGAILEHGYDSPEGKAALRRMNHLHGRFAISNEDFVYVLTTFVVVPVRWIDAVGWRRLTDGERHAAYAYYREVGRRMGIRDVPGSYEDCAAFLDAYERAHFAPTPAVTRTGVATRELLVGWLRPVPPRLTRTVVHALLEPRLREVFGFPEPPRLLPPALRTALRARSRVVRFLPARRTPVTAWDNPYQRTYDSPPPVGRLGPPPYDD